MNCYDALLQVLQDLSVRLYCWSWLKLGLDYNPSCIGYLPRSPKASYSKLPVCIRRKPIGIY